MLDLGNNTYSFFNAGSSSTLSSRSSTVSNDSTLSRGNLSLWICHWESLIYSPLIQTVTFHTGTSSQRVTASLTLDKPPVAGEPICFTVKVKNRQRVAKKLIVHLNAQAKEYNNSPSDTFWKNHGVVQLAPMEGKFPSPLDCCIIFY